jgi:DNA-binding ferritin-like protein
MNELAILFRFKQLLSHNMHNQAARVAFFSDHEFFGDMYSKAESDYDSIIERMMGLGQAVDFNAIQVQAVQKLQAIPMAKDNTEMCSQLLSLNKQLLQIIEVFCKSPISQGTMQLVGGMADELEKENYKLGQRVKK